MRYGCIIKLVTARSKGTEARGEVKCGERGRLLIHPADWVLTPESERRVHSWMYGFWTRSRMDGEPVRLFNVYTGSNKEHWTVAPMQPATFGSPRTDTGRSIANETRKKKRRAIKGNMQGTEAHPAAPRGLFFITPDPKETRDSSRTNYTSTSSLSSSSAPSSSASSLISTLTSLSHASFTPS